MEVHYALEDWFTVMDIKQQYFIRPLAEVSREHAVVYYNSQVKKHQQIKDSTRFMMMPWEFKAWQEKQQSVDEMKQQLQAIADAFGKKK